VGVDGNGDGDGMWVGSFIEINC